jgi:hypothetical protein
MKYTVLEMVQRILESMEDDEVNSITDTASATQVANIIKENYFFLTGQADLPEHWDFVQLNSSGDADKPVLMTVPSNVLKLEWVKYQDSSDDSSPYQIVEYKDMDDFLKISDALNTSDTNVDTMEIDDTGEVFRYNFINDAQPKYYTTFNDNTLLFDSYDSGEDSTLTQSKTMCYAQLAPTFTLEDSHTPDLDHKQFQLLLQMSKAQAFEEMKQTELGDARRKERRGWVNVQRTKRKVQRRNELDFLPNYARKR